MHWHGKIFRMIWIFFFFKFIYCVFRSLVLHCKRHFQERPYFHLLKWVAHALSFQQQSANNLLRTRHLILPPYKLPRHTSHTLTLSNTSPHYSNTIYFTTTSWWILCKVSMSISMTRRHRMPAPLPPITTTGVLRSLQQNKQTISRYHRSMSSCSILRMKLPGKSGESKTFWTTKDE